METTQQTDHLRKSVAGVAMLASPVLAIAGWAIYPTLKSDEGEQLRELAGGTTRATIGLSLDLLSTALAVFAVLGAVHLLREREMMLGSVGGGMAIIGLVGVAVMTGLQGSAIELARSGVTDANVGIYEDMMGGRVFWLGMAGGFIVSAGMVILAVGLYRARAVPEPSALLLGVFAVAQLVGFGMASTPIVVASFVILFAAIAPVGVQILRETDAEWEHAPRFHMYKPMHV